MAADLPGAYSMSLFTSKESITSDFIRNENLSVIITLYSIKLMKNLFTKHKGNMKFYTMNLIKKQRLRVHQSDRSQNIP